MEPKEFKEQAAAIVKETNDALLWNKIEPVTVEVARTWVLQFGQFTRHSRQCWANVVGNCPVIAVRRFIVTENLWEEEANEATSHFDILLKMGRSVGLSDDQVRNATPVASTTTALLAWETMTRSRPWIEGLAAKAVLEMTNLEELGDWSGREGRRWMSALGLSEDDVEFFLLHAEVDQEHARGALDGVMEYGNSVDLDRAMVAVQSSMSAWKVLFDGMALAATEAARGGATGALAGSGARSE